MKILSLNCQNGFNPNLLPFLRATLAGGAYDFLLLQEFTSELSDAIGPDLDGYRLLHPYNDEKGDHNHLAILYRAAYALRQERLVPLPDLHPRIVRPLTFGLLLGTFRAGGEDIRIGSIHLHSGLRARVRRKGLSIIRDALIADAGDAPTVLGGDCNFGLFWERRSGKKILGFDFEPVSYHLPPTLDSRYTEPAVRIMNRTVALLRKYDIGIRVSTDHFFVSQSLLETSSADCRVLPDRVSDHSPIELTLSAK